MSKARFAFITGLSGAGKTTVIQVLEDIGFFCIDNLPPSLIPRLADLVEQSPGVGRVALVIDMRGGTFFDSTMAALDELQTRGISYQVLFLEAADDALIRRYKETRRRHPLAGDGGVLEGIRRERERMTEVRSRADHVIDTTHTSSLALRNHIVDLFSTGRAQSLQLSLCSFGFKYGVPADADLMLDVRFIPNPHYVPELADQDGNDADVAAFVLQQPVTEQFMARLWDLLDFLLPHYVKEGKSHLTVAVGCTGGRHRSVSVINRLAQLAGSTPHSIRVEHRDLGRESS